ncbi:MAG: YoaK family protein [Bacteroidales bacterium]
MDENQALYHEDRAIQIWIYSVSFLSAFINMAGFMAFAYALSHYSGNYTLIIEYIYNHGYNTALVLLLLSLSFTIGGFISAFVNVNKEFKLESKYGEIQFVIGIMMLFLYLVFYNEDLFIYFLACALGTQNGLIRSYRGVGFKTTHVTGTFTDLGTFLGYMVRGEANMGWKIKFEVFLLLSFALGTLLSIVLFGYMKEKIFIPGAIGYLLSGIFFFILRGRSEKRDQ